MHSLILDKGSFGPQPSAQDLAHHLYTRMNSGKVVIIAKNPRTLLSTLRKRWLQLARKVQTARASTVDAIRIRELNESAEQMQALRFTTKWPPDEHLPADIYIATIDELLRWAPEYRTLYVTCDVESEQLHLVTALMPRGGLVVVCGLS